MTQGSIKEGRIGSEVISKLTRLTGLIRDSKFTEAREYADELKEEGISKPLINHACYNQFGRLNKVDREVAERLAKVFAEYGWQHWLDLK